MKHTYTGERMYIIALSQQGGAWLSGYRCYPTRELAEKALSAYAKRGVLCPKENIFTLEVVKDIETD